MIIHKNWFSKGWNFTEVTICYFKDRIPSVSVWNGKQRRSRRWSVGGAADSKPIWRCAAFCLFLFLPLDGRQTLQTQPRSSSFDPCGSLMSSVWEIIILTLTLRKNDCENWYFIFLFKWHTDKKTKKYYISVTVFMYRTS